MNDLCIIMDIAGRTAAINAADVQSVIELEQIHPVPRTPAFVKGLTAMRSQSLTVIDARCAIGVDTDTPCGDRAAIVRIDGFLYALQVDDIHDVATILSEPTPVPGGLGEAWRRVARGMMETSAGPALLLDVEAMIRGPSDRAA